MASAYVQEVGGHTCCFPFSKLGRSLTKARIGLVYVKRRLKSSTRSSVCLRRIRMFLFPQRFWSGAEPPRTQGRMRLFKSS
jgi:hypothetical protein